MSFCRTCTSRLAQHALKGVARPTATSSRYIASTSIRSENNDALDRAKARAWYLDPKPTPADTAGPSKPTRREPRFTTFDPESTRSDLVTEDIIPLHENATSPLLAQLHDHLTRQSDSVDHASVRFLHTPSSGLLRTQTQEQEGLGVDGALLGESGNTNWEWVVTCQVRGRGRGVLNRAEKEIRKWVSRVYPCLPTSMKSSNGSQALICRCARH
jgi:hypothetical protein